MIRELQYKNFDKFEDYDRWHKDHYQNNNALKETGLWINDGKVTAEYILLY